MNVLMQRARMGVMALALALAGPVWPVPGLPMLGLPMLSLPVLGLPVLGLPVLGLPVLGVSLLGVSGLAVSGPAMAQEAVADRAVFDLVIKGISAGSLSFSGTQSGKGYAVQGQLKSGGLVGMLRKIRFEASARGSYSKGRYVPSSYSETADTGKRQSESVMAYKGGVPQVKVSNPPRDPQPGDVAPSSQGGSVDPLTALYATLRDVAAGQECSVAVNMFDGRRASKIVLAKPKAQGDSVICAGEYRRVAGFSADEMAEKVRFPFTLTYAPVEGGKMRVVEVAMDSLYGKARLTRR